jgi:hypothetical protein
MKILVGAYTLKLTEHKNLKDGNTKLKGQCDVYKGTIRLDKGMPRGDKYLTLWHEVVHAIASDRFGHKISENAVNQLSRGIVQALRDNPSLRRVR